MAQDANGNYIVEMTIPAPPVYVPSSGEGGATSMFRSNANPNGVIAASGPAICLGYGAADGLMWRKVTAGSSNSEWVAV